MCKQHQASETETGQGERIYAGLQFFAKVDEFAICNLQKLSFNNLQLNNLQFAITERLQIADCKLNIANYFICRRVASQLSFIGISQLFINSSLV